VDVHDLTPAYALHALDDDERATYETHLAQCERCRTELALLQESAGALAWAVEAPPPPPRLRARILDAATGGDVVPFRPRRRLWQGLAAVAACAAVGLGIWAATLSRTLHHERASAAQVVELQGRRGMVAVTRARDAVLVVDELPSAPAGMTYEAWVIPKGGAPEAAGMFKGTGGLAMVHLRMKVPRGAVVAATIEHAGGADAPTSTPILTAQT
jgi:anti-sigma-K factor RskA